MESNYDGCHDAGLLLGCSQGGKAGTYLVELCGGESGRAQQGGDQCALAAACLEGLQQYLDGLRSLRLLRPWRFRTEGRHEDLVWQQRGIEGAHRQGPRSWNGTL